MFAKEIEKEKRLAEEYRGALYRLGEVSRDEAKKYIMPYIDAFNQKSTEIAKKYKMLLKKSHSQSLLFLLILTLMLILIKINILKGEHLHEFIRFYWL